MRKSFEKMIVDSYMKGCVIVSLLLLAFSLINWDLTQFILSIVIVILFMVILPITIVWMKSLFEVKSDDTTK